MIASELVTNAVLHARTPLDDVGVPVRKPAPCGRSLTNDSRPPTPRVAGSDDATGLGMQVVEALCQDWGVLFAAGGSLSGRSCRPSPTRCDLRADAPPRRR